MFCARIGRSRLCWARRSDPKICQGTVERRRKLKREDELNAAQVHESHRTRIEQMFSCESRRPRLRRAGADAVHQKDCPFLLQEPSYHTLPDLALCPPQLWLADNLRNETRISEGFDHR